MDEQSKLSIANWLAFLEPAFPEVEKPRPAYTHIGALLADVSLQASMDYERIVRPRVCAILNAYPHQRTTEECAHLLAEVGEGAFLQWRGREKRATFRALVDTLLAERVSTVCELSSWVEGDGARRTILSISGIGRKSYDYLRLLCGKVSFPIDRHMIRFLTIAGIKVTEREYERAQSLLFDACRIARIEPHVAERGLWLLLSGCK